MMQVHYMCLFSQRCHNQSCVEMSIITVLLEQNILFVVSTFGILDVSNSTNTRKTIKKLC